MKPLVYYMYRAGDDDLLDMESFFEEAGLFSLQEAWNKGWEEIVDENLKTHNKSLLQRQLKKRFPDLEFVNPSDDDIDCFKIYQCDGKVSIANIAEEDEFKDMLAFFGYVVKRVRQEDDLKYYLYVEPVYSENAYDYVWRECKGICYHFTDKGSVRSILENGLRLRDVNSGIRYRGRYPKKIYLYCKPNYAKLNKKDLEFAYQVTNKDAVKENGLACIRVDLHRCHSISLYKDTMMEANAVFTYTSIPPECCKEIGLQKI